MHMVVLLKTYSVYRLAVFPGLLTQSTCTQACLLHVPRLACPVYMFPGLLTQSTCSQACLPSLHVPRLAYPVYMFPGLLTTCSQACYSPVTCTKAREKSLGTCLIIESVQSSQLVSYQVGIDGIGAQVMS